MTPIRPDFYDYSFNRAVIAEIRKKLSLSQSKFAELLDIPVNTLSRWEIGTTTPDADTLAAIYSIAKQYGISPNFFKRRLELEQVSKHRTKLLLAWDFQNKALKVEEIEDEWGYMKGYLDLLFPATRASRTLRTYAQTQLYQTFNQPTVKETYESLKFEVFEGSFDADSQLIKDSLRECSPNPQKTIFILVAEDGHYSEFLKELRGNGVDVYIWAEQDLISEKLKSAIEENHLIFWDRPYLIMECIEVIKTLKGEPITRSNFGQLCREKLQKYEVYPQDEGFSKRNPYGSLLTWLEKQGLVTVRIIKEPDIISISLKR